MKVLLSSVVRTVVLAVCLVPWPAWSLVPHSRVGTRGSWSYRVAAPPSVASRRRRAVVPTALMEGIASRLTEAIQTIGGVKRISESAVAGALKDVKRALLDSDVNLQVANAIVDGVKERAVGVKLIEGVTAEQQFIKLMYDELVEIMGNGTTPLAANEDASERPTVVLMAGLQGAGKTTSAAKLAMAISTTDKGESTGRGALLAGADIYRPAAIKQLQTLGEQIGVEVFSLGTEVSAVEIAEKAVERAAELQRETGMPYTVIVDTAGRQVIDDDLMKELAGVKSAVKPDETLLVVDAMTGQEAATLTARFNDDIGITGAILTKLDGDTRGGAAISVRAVSGCSIKFVGVGEKMAPLQPFYPDRLASRILGMGDVVSLVEKAQAKVSEADAEKMMQKMQDASFDFNDFLAQSKMISSMGSMSGVMGMLPGMAGQLSKSDLMAAEKKIKRSESMINSMTKKERVDPSLLITDRSAASRATRIAKGSGTTVRAVQEFLAEFQQMRTMMSRMSKGMGGGPADSSAGQAMDPSALGNRRARRAGKKGKKGGSKVGSGGFGRR